VVGAGAIGLLVAGRLAARPSLAASRAAADGTQPARRAILLARPGTAAALQQQRLRLLHDGALHVADSLITITEPSALDPRDQLPELAILCVKAYDTAGALPTLAALNPQAILTLQNGIGNEEILAERFGVGRVVSGAITTSVEIVAPGRIEEVKRGGIGLAPMCAEARPAAERALAALSDAGFETRRYDDYRALKWSKALLNMLGNATAAILDMPVAEIYADARLVALERRAFLEALAVMDRLGIAALNLPRYPAALLAQAMRYLPAPLLNPLLGKKIAGGRGGKAPSLQLDLARGNKRSEGDFLYGAIAHAGAEAGVATPVNRALWETLRALINGTAAWDDYRRQPERLLEAVAKADS
jgi:2-dehydropantoate 2-reductase